MCHLYPSPRTLAFDTQLPPNSLPNVFGQDVEFVREHFVLFVMAGGFFIGRAMNLGEGFGLAGALYLLPCSFPGNAGLHRRHKRHTRC